MNDPCTITVDATRLKAQIARNAQAWRAPIVGVDVGMRFVELRPTGELILEAYLKGFDGDR